jgi:hypothetical protein
VSDRKRVKEEVRAVKINVTEIDKQPVRSLSVLLKSILPAANFSSASSSNSENVW